MVAHINLPAGSYTVVAAACNRTDLRKIVAAIGTPYYLAKPFRSRRSPRTIERALAEAIPARPPGMFG